MKIQHRAAVLIVGIAILMAARGTGDAAADAGAGPQSVAVTVGGLAAFPPDGVPVRCGLPLGKGLVKDTSQVRLLDAAGKEVPVQAQPTGYWSDGSLKWLTLEFLARGRRYRAEIGAKSTARPKSPLKATETKPGAAESPTAHSGIPAGASHILTVPSSEPETSLLPSGEYATA